MAMALSAGLPLRDMEMVQFHPTGLLAGAHTRMTGTVLEEGLRGAGGYLLDGAGERFMQNYDPRGERATRDIVSRAIYAEMRAGRTTPHGGVWLSMAHLGADNVRRQFKGMVERCADCGFDLAGGRVEVVPTAHYMMGGVEFAADCTTALRGIVRRRRGFGRRARRQPARRQRRRQFDGVRRRSPAMRWRRGLPATAVSRRRSGRDRGRDRPRRAPFRIGTGRRPRGDARATAHDDVGRRRHRARRREPRARAERAGYRCARELAHYALPAAARDRAFNLTWHDWLNLSSLVAVSAAIVRAAVARRGFAGRAFPRGLPRDRRPRRIGLHPRAAARRGARRRKRSGALHARQARGRRCSPIERLRPVIALSQSAPTMSATPLKTGLAR